ncbi:MAG: hypothetical protein LKE46_12440 [Clostridium sp.]|jgi:hypothetical protein|uniref:hypothetical protein n=1 Tax=Clostridium sp. TaxID=1506 RepID=UPI0025BF0E78|nr:hypothetical protein [Clostridium sp.]MCH3965069.1 hypothetical protein [Clostridium sp.]MCI1714290.1 hypothetical protein [Clostridium sp.]MCI1798552.1 hypothetical protein [Clostridium sp.]MCI1812717.1 hypothetical protein [Clostridium sp.]MCI1869361.1 hypothetical protein [Clostridium sp.]
MSDIYINSYNNQSNLDINNLSISKITDENQSNNSSKELMNDDTKDKVEISVKNDILINTKKAYDAFKETNKEYGIVSADGYYQDMSVILGHIEVAMKIMGLPTATFDFNGLTDENKENGDFLGFIDKIKNFAHELNKKNEGTDLMTVPDSFFDFCDSFKSKLKQYGCK